MQNKNYRGMLVDMVTPLDLQAKLDPKLEISDIKLSMSMQIDKEECDIQKTELIEYDGLKKQIFEKNFRLREGVITTQKEFLEHIKDEFGKETSGAIIKRRNIVKRVSGNLSYIPGLDGHEKIILAQISRGNYTNMIRNTFNFQFLANTAEIAREHLTPLNWINEENEYLLGKLRSNIITKTVLDEREESLTDLNAIHDISLNLADKWNKDVAMSSLYTFQDLGEYPGALYHLEKQGVEVVL